MMLTLLVTVMNAVRGVDDDNGGDKWLEKKTVTTLTFSEVMKLMFDDIERFFVCEGNTLLAMYAFVLANRLSRKRLGKR